MASSSLSDRLGFSKKEDLAILEFILKDHRLYFSGGLNIWKRAANEGICPNRGFWSLKERFMKTICKNLQHYNLPIETRHRILNYIKASPAEKKRLRTEYGDDQDFKYVHQPPSKTTIIDEEKNTDNENLIINKEIVEFDENNSVNPDHDSPSKAPNTNEEKNTENKNVIVKKENLEFDEDNNFKNETELQSNSKSSTSENDPMISPSSLNMKSISESQPIITNIKCNLFKDILPVNKSKIVSDQETENESFQTLGKSSSNPKQKSCRKNKKAIPENRQLRVTLTRLKNL